MGETITLIAAHMESVSPNSWLVVTSLRRTGWEDGAGTYRLPPPRQRGGLPGPFPQLDFLVWENERYDPDLGIHQAVMGGACGKTATETLGTSCAVSAGAKSRKFISNVKHGYQPNRAETSRDKGGFKPQWKTWSLCQGAGTKGLDALVCFCLLLGLLIVFIKP